jgi:hypothetical protein
MFRGVLEWRPRPTPGCSAIEEEEEEDDEEEEEIISSSYMFWLVHCSKLQTELLRVGFALFTGHKGS